MKSDIHSVKTLMIVRMQTPSSPLRLVEFRQRNWVDCICDTEDIIHSIITISVFHHSLTIRCKVHHLQTFTLLVVSVGRLRAITKFRIDRMTLFFVTNLINNITIKYVFLKEWYPCVSSFF